MAATLAYDIESLDGPVTEPFDCGEELQNKFLLESAWAEQQERSSVTYLMRCGGVLAGYVTLAMSGIDLEVGARPEGSRAHQPAMRLAQMGVDKRFRGHDFGVELFGYAVYRALLAAEQVGCRYLILESLPQRVSFYEEKCGCVQNVEEQKRRRRRAEKAKRDPDQEAVSMRYDLRPIGELNVHTLSHHTGKSRAVPALIAVGTAAFFSWVMRRRAKKA